MKRIAGLVVLVLVAVLGWGIWHEVAHDDPDCDLKASKGKPSAAKEPAVLKPEAPEGLVVPFGRSRGLETEIIYATVAKGDALKEGGPDLRVRKRPLRRQEIYGVIYPREYEVAARIVGRREIAVRICVPSRLATDVDPGTYVGGVTIVDARAEKTTVPITVSLQFTKYLWVLVPISIIVLVAGTFAVWAAGRRAAAGGKNPDVFLGDARQDYLAWFRLNLIPVIAGCVAATSAFLIGYWRNPSWGAKAPEDWFGLLGVMFSAFTAALSATSRGGWMDDEDGNKVLRGAAPGQRARKQVEPPITAP